LGEQGLEEQDPEDLEEKDLDEQDPEDPEEQRIQRSRIYPVRSMSERCASLLRCCGRAAVWIGAVRSVLPGRSVRGWFGARGTQQLQPSGGSELPRPVAAWMMEGRVGCLTTLGCGACPGTNC